MKTNILGTTPERYRKILCMRIGKCIGITCLALLANTLLTLFRSEENHTLLLLLNIVIDIACAFFMIYYISEYVLPPRRLYRLFFVPSHTYSGVVRHISAETQRYRGIDCVVITIDTHCFFLPAEFPEPEIGVAISVKTASNIILEVEQ